MSEEIGIEQPSPPEPSSPGFGPVVPLFHRDPDDGASIVPAVSVSPEASLFERLAALRMTLPVTLGTLALAGLAAFFVVWRLLAASNAP